MLEAPVSEMFFADSGPVGECSANQSRSVIGHIFFLWFVITMTNEIQQM
jgi:hypothetical protein